MTLKGHYMHFAMPIVWLIVQLDTSSNCQ